MRHSIKAPDGSLRGYILEQGTRKELHAPNGKLLGYYLITQDKTCKPSGELVGFGEQLTILLEN